MPVVPSSFLAWALLNAVTQDDDRKVRGLLKKATAEEVNWQDKVSTLHG